MLHIATALGWSVLYHYGKFTITLSQITLGRTPLDE